MVRALLANFFLVTTAALVGMGLVSGKLRQRCFSVSHGVPEHSLSRQHSSALLERAPHVLQPSARPLVRAPRRVRGRVRVPGAGRDERVVLGQRVVGRPLRHPPGLAQSLGPSVDARVGRGGLVLAAVLGGALVRLNILVPLLVTQLEKRRNLSKIEAGKRMIRR
jgi:hypothetical protein